MTFNTLLNSPLFYTHWNCSTSIVHIECLRIWLYYKDFPCQRVCTLYTFTLFVLTVYLRMFWVHRIYPRWSSFAGCTVKAPSESYLSHAFVDSSSKFGHDGKDLRNIKQHAIQDVEKLVETLIVMFWIEYFTNKADLHAPRDWWKERLNCAMCIEYELGQKVNSVGYNPILSTILKVSNGSVF